MPNRLAQAQSLYLRKHADNPIDWWPWCDAAIAKARAENKPIFLSIGYSSCHWCTVMEGEAFSDETIAAYMNSQFVPIKIDREERPDVDSIYMQSLQMMTGQGGWPLNVFLSPTDLVPFYGGTYFPLAPKYGRPGFLQVLQAIRRLHDSEQDKVQTVKADILENLNRAAQLPQGGPLTPLVLTQGLADCTQILGAGGYGPSFPMIPYALATLRGGRLFPTTADRAIAAQAAAKQRGLDLALGGIFDHVGGGWHRYTVDPTWTVPHFEKMLYDNGQIMEFLAELWSSGVQEPAFAQAIALTATWLQREMTAPTGYFYAAQDADSFATPTAAEPEEGDFYVWRYEELAALLTPTALAELASTFTISEAGNFEGRNVLKRRPDQDLGGAGITESLAQLFAVRYGQAPGDRVPPARNNAEAKQIPWPGRIPPVTDTKMIVAWNSLMISGLARAYAVFREPLYAELAQGAIHFILTQQRVGDRLHRLNYEGTVSVLAQSEDYALLIKALIDLHQAGIGAEPAVWLTTAIALQAEMDTFLWSVETGGYFNTASDASEQLLLRERSYQDNATPAANGVAIANLIRLALLTEDLNYLEWAERSLIAFSSVLNTAPRSCPSLLSALDWWQHYTLVRTHADRLPELRAQYLPTAVYRTEPNLPSEQIGLVCQGLSCQAPATTAAEFWAQLTASQQRGLNSSE